jgi:uncharacterized Zn finger protein
MTAIEKARTLLAEGRCQVMFATDQIVLARVEGDHDRYEVRWSSLRGWSCSCPEQRGRCSHISCVRSITMRPPIAAGRP